MKPSRVLRLYLAITFCVGILLSIPTALMVNQGELDFNAGIILAVCWNAIFLMVLPLVLDWSERKYFKARFIGLEELETANPELKLKIEEQCERLSLAGLRFATVESGGAEAFAYGLWRQNPRLIVPTSCLSTEETTKLLPSIEVELTRFASHDLTLVFLAFAAFQAVVGILLVQFI